MRSAAILAGGRASRFGGRDKSALVVDGATILERQIAALTAVVGDAGVLLVGARAPRAGIRAADDIMPGSGPLGGIHAALTILTARPEDAVFVAACDMPYLAAPFVAHLFELAANADLVLPRTERGYHPLCAVYTGRCLEPIARRLAEGRLKVMDLAGDVRTRVVAREEIDRFGNRHRLLANVNTPAEYAALEAVQGHKA
jgi:molybdenum cofactor guanylyltransferase